MSAHDTRNDWLAERRSGIGSSDVAPILGVAPPSWGRGPHSVFAQKMGWSAPAEAPHLQWGHDMESAILRYVEREHGLTLLCNANLFRHPDRLWAVATPDALVLRGARPVGVCEVKNYGSDDGWGRDGDEAGDGTVPDHVRLQVWHQQWVTGLRGESYVAASLWGRPPRLYPIAWEPDYERLIVPQLRAFWALVEAGTPPAVDGSDECRATLQRLAPVRDEAVERPDLEAAALELARLKQAVKDAEAAEALASNRLLADVGSARRTVAGPCRLTRVVVSGRETLDLAALRAEEPEVWTRYARTGRPSEYLRLTVKGV